MKIGRTLINCSKCEKTKLHYGLGMCSSCLRQYKRQNRPSFYLGTCYSELSRRVKTFDRLRPNYFGKEKCSKSEFFNKFLNDKNFLKLYKNWQKSGFQRKYSPSIDRIDNTKGYILNNLQFITQGNNSVKDIKIKICLVKNKKEFHFESCKDAAKFLGIKPPTFCKIRKKHNLYKGFYIYEL